MEQKKKNSPRSSALLVLTAFIWGVAFVAQSQAQQIHPHYRQPHADPDIKAHPPVKEDSCQGHQDYVQRRDKASLAHGGLRNAELLQRAGRHQAQAAADPTHDTGAGPSTFW